jgi:hypothetical protein
VSGTYSTDGEMRNISNTLVKRDHLTNYVRIDLCIDVINGSEINNA